MDNGGRAVKQSHSQVLSLIVFYTIQHAIQWAVYTPPRVLRLLVRPGIMVKLIDFCLLHTDEDLKSVVHNMNQTNIIIMAELSSQVHIRQLSMCDRPVSNVSYLVVLKLRRWQSDCNAPTNFIVKISVALKWSRDIVSVLAAQLRLRAHNGKCQRQPLSKCVSHTSSKYTNKSSSQHQAVVALLLSLLKSCLLALCPGQRQRPVNSALHLRRPCSHRVLSP